MTDRILLGFDGSDSAINALSFSVDLARAFGAELHVVAVTRPPEFADEVETRAIIDSSRRQYQRLLEAVRKRLASETFNVQLEVVVGQPAEQIVRYAEINGVDHIVVGQRGHTLFDRWLIGSVARQVIAYAHCSVTVVRN